MYLLHFNFFNFYVFQLLCTSFLYSKVLFVNFLILKFVCKYFYFEIFFNNLINKFILKISNIFTF